MRQVVVLPVPAVEGELQHLHAGVARVFQQFAYRGGEEAQVLGNDVLSAQSLVHRLEESDARAGLPPAIAGGLVAVGDGVVGVEAPEVVDAQGVVQLELEGDAPQPPGVAVLLHFFPVEKGVAPKLAVGGEAVGGTSGHLGGQALPVQLELVRVGPHVGAVSRDVDRQIADDGDAQGIDVLLPGVPLVKKEVLHRLPEGDLPSQFGPDLFQGGGPAQAQRLGPGEPGGSAVPIFQGHEQGIVLQPVLLFLAESGEIRPALGQQPVTGLVEHGVARLIHQPVVHIFRIVPPVEGRKLGPLQQPLTGQGVQVDKIGVAGEGREGLVGGIAVAGGAHGKDLPAALAAGGQKVGKLPGLRPQGPNPVGGGQGGDRH